MNGSIGVPSGFRDILFEEARARRDVESALAQVFTRHGYGEIIPSSIEYFETYERGDRGMQDRVYRFLNRDDVLLALRADFTLSIARIAATRFADAPPPHRVWYCGNVFRKLDPTKGNYKETTQIGAELLGVNSARSDVEVLQLALRCLDALGVKDVQLHLNHAGVFKGIVDSLELNEEALQSVRSEIDRKDMRALAAHLRDHGVSRESVSQLDLLSRSIGDEQVLTQAEKTLTAPDSLAALAELRNTANALSQWSDRITFDLTEIDEMEYYTGVFFTFFSPNLRGALGRGGRYDGMLAAFRFQRDSPSAVGVPMPAVGFSLSIEELVRLR